MRDQLFDASNPISNLLLLDTFYDSLSRSQIFRQCGNMVVLELFEEAVVCRSSL